MSFNSFGNFYNLESPYQFQTCGKDVFKFMSFDFQQRNCYIYNLSTSKRPFNNVILYDSYLSFFHKKNSFVVRISLQQHIILVFNVSYGFLHYYCISLFTVDFFPEPRRPDDLQRLQRLSSSIWKSVAYWKIPQAHHRVQNLKN